MNNNKLNVLREVVENGFGMADMDIIDRYVSEDVIEHQFGRANGRDSLKKSITGLALAFSDRKYKLLQQAVKGNRVWGHYQFTGKHTGVFVGHEPTGKMVCIDVMDIVIIKYDQIVEHWGVPDRLALLAQIGAIGGIT